MLIDKVLSNLTLEEKAYLCSGKDFWHLKALKRFNIPSVMMADGPHGLRKQTQSDLETGSTKSIKATCFPTASTTANSWDIDLLNNIGIAIAEECLSEDVSILLAPGINIKRSPLCGRNFEYFSEDPYLSGKLASAFISGVQSKGIGTAIKHFACNNQETKRMTINSIVDERALHEIYLLGFEIAIKESSPWLVMTAYNRVNGYYCSENINLLKTILNDKWKYDGVIVSDWGATNDRVDGIKAGLDLEMPSSYGYNDKKIIKAVKNGDLSIDTLDKSVRKILKLIDTSIISNKYTTYNKDHHNIAYKAAIKSAVLLKNINNILPLNKSHKIALIGGLAESIRYQGSGSSSINPINLENILAEFSKTSINFSFAKGYSIENDEIHPMYIYEACDIAKISDIVILFIGLTEEYESEGFDRTHLTLPKNQIALIESVLAINTNVIIVLSGGSPVDLSWDNANIRAILNIGLCGEAGPSAIVDLLLGNAVPSGKLSETYPYNLSDTPSISNFPGGPKTVEYRESIYVGYRYYDKSNTPVKYCFGHGLSYTTFSYTNIIISNNKIIDTDILKVSVDIENTGTFVGEEIVQLYIHHENPTIFKAEKELKGFKKISLSPKEKSTVSFLLSKRDFAFYNILIKDWCVETGDYDILIGSSSRDIRCNSRIHVISSGNFSIPDYSSLKSYYKPSKNGLNISEADFKLLYGKELPINKDLPTQKYDINSTLGEIKNIFLGKRIYDLTIELAYSMFPNANKSVTLSKMIEAVTEDFPLRNLVTLSNGKFSPYLARTLIKMMNEDYLKKLAIMIQNNIR